MIRNMILIVVMIIATGLFASIEAAIIALNENKIKMMADTGDQKALTLLRYLKERSKYLCAIQSGMIFCGLMAGALSEHFFVNQFFVFLKENITFLESDMIYGASMILITLLLTYFVMVFGRFTPKRYGIKNAENLVYSTLKFQRIFVAITRPFVGLASILANFFSRLMGINPKEVDAHITEEEIRMMVDAGGGSGSIDENEMEMINNIFEFDNTAAGDIATHRTDIVAVPLDASLESIIKVISEEKYSRIPVYGENIDDIVGVFHVKDIVKLVLNIRENNQEAFQLQDVLMKPYFVPFTKKTDELFEQMQKDKIYMAIIIDEYGGTAGIVTMEDLLEEIVGNIFDEYDKEEKEDILIVDENTFLIDGSTDLDEIEDTLGIQFDEQEEQDYDTIAGFLIGQLGRVPDDWETPNVECKGYLFQIEKIGEKRIERIRATKNEKES